MQGRPQGLGARGEDHGVVGLGVGPASPGFPDVNGPGGTVYGHRIVTNPDVHGQPGPEFLRGHHEKAVPFRDRAAGIVGKTAVRVADVVSPFQENDLGRLVQAAQAGRGGSASCDASDDHVGGHGSYR